MSSESNKTLVRRFSQEILSQRDTGPADELLTVDFVSHFAGMPEPIRGRDAWRQLATAYFTAFPDLHETIEDIVAEGDRIVTRVTVSGTHHGPFMGLPATGNHATWSAMAIFRVTDGQLAEEWVEQDTMSLMQQLGSLPQST
jgi:steroid delta-isomerase-like uncharacterized protein